MYPRTVKVRSSSGAVNEYVRVVAAYREAGKAKQRVVANLGRKDFRVAILPKLRTLLGDNQADPQFLDASTWGPVLVVRTWFEPLGLWDFLDRKLDRAKGVSFAARAFVLVADRVIATVGMVMVAGLPIAHHVREGNRIVHSTVQDVISDLRKHVNFSRLVFVGDH